MKEPLTLFDIYLAWEGEAADRFAPWRKSEAAGEAWKRRIERLKEEVLPWLAENRDLVNPTEAEDVRCLLYKFLELPRRRIPYNRPRYLDSLRNVLVAMNEGPQPQTGRSDFAP